MRTGAAFAISVLALAAALTARPAHAEKLIVSVSNHRVTVTPNYSGEELVLFGSVEKDAGTPANRSYNLVVTVSGPRADMVTRLKVTCNRKQYRNFRILFGLPRLLTRTRNHFIAVCKILF